MIGLDIKMARSGRNNIAKNEATRTMKLPQWTGCVLKVKWLQLCTLWVGMWEPKYKKSVGAR